MLVLSLVTSAVAHEALEEPIPRYPSDGSADIKACPCGVGANDGRCSDPDERSDPNRDEGRVTVYEAGETVTVRLREVIGHTGRWRIAFDRDGADMDDFNAEILLDEPDPSGSEGNVGQGDLWEFEITLPDVACDTCTLQVVQVMNGDTETPVADPTGASSYYQCADLVLVAGPGGTEPTAPIDTGTPPADDGSGGCGCTGARPTGGALLPLALVLRRRPRGRPAS